MTATTGTSMTINCDVCSKPWKGDDGVWQWDTLAEARSAATEENWFVRSDGYAICPSPFGWKHNNTARELLDGHHGGLSDSERDDLLAVRRWLERDYRGDEDGEHADFPVVTLCGSMKFYPRMLEIAAELTTAGQIVLMPHDASLTGIENKTALEHGAMLDAMHRQKIRMSGSVYIVNTGGYVGESTRSEIAYATELGIPIQYDEVA